MILAPARRVMISEAVRPMPHSITEPYQICGNGWKWVHVKMTNSDRFAGLITAHIWSGAEATNLLLVLPSWLLDAVVALRICQWMSLWLKDVCCSNRAAGIRDISLYFTKQKL